MSVSKRSVVVALAVAAAIYMAFWLFFERGNPPGSAAPNRPATDITIRTSTGPVSLASLRGKVVILDFWATWCGPCRMSIPGLQQVYAKHKDQGLAIMGVALEHDDGAGIAPFVKAMGMTYPVGLPASAESIKAYTTGSIPLMVFVDRRGMVRDVKEGFTEGRDEEIEQIVASLLKEGS